MVVSVKPKVVKSAPSLLEAKVTDSAREALNDI